MRHLKTTWVKVALLLLSMSVLSALNVPDVKQEAFEVLETKCNSCHVKRNPSRVFTLDNMDTFAPAIHKQVFKFKRMPKGKTRLTAQESASLKNWLLTQNIK